MNAPCRPAPALRVRSFSSARAQATSGRETPGALHQLAAGPVRGKLSTSQTVVSALPPPPAFSAPPPALVAAGVLASAAALKYVLDRPSRPYEAGSVGREYDAWTQEGILEYYWGAHSPASPF